MTLEQTLLGSTTLETFRHELQATGLEHNLLETLDRLFKAQGLAAGEQTTSWFQKLLGFNCLN